MPWADNGGFEYFIRAFSNRDFLNALRNTLMLNFLDLLVGFPAPIIFALLLNELAFKRFKRFTQTVTYMPHFLSWIIIAGMALQLFAPTTGLINIFLRRYGLDPIPFLNEPGVLGGDIRLPRGLEEPRVEHHHLPGGAHEHQSRSSMRLRRSTGQAGFKRSGTLLCPACARRLSPCSS